MSGRGKSLILAVMSILIALILGEIFLRVAWNNPYQSEAPDKILMIRTQHKNANLTVDRSIIYPDADQTQLRTDDRGYILPSFQFDNPEFTVAFLGGSTTECSAVGEKKRFHSIVSELLESEFRVNTLNASRSGNTVHDSINILLNHVVTDHPDIVIIMHAANDFGLLATTGGYDKRMGEYVSFKLLGRWAAQMASRVSLFGIVRDAMRLAPGWRKLDVGDGGIGRSIDTMDGATVRPDGRIEIDVPVDLFRERLEVFVGICRAFDILPILMTQPASPLYRTKLTPSWVDASYQNVFNDVIREVGFELDVMVIDLVEYLNARVERWQEPMVVFYDALHITDHGSELYALHISERLAPLMRDWAETGQSLAAE
jgi:hypothetical protein